MNARLHILVTGANGQLGMEFRQLAEHFPHVNWFFTGKEDLSVSDEKSVRAFCTRHAIQYIINCAAYTAVDQAEMETAMAFQINGEAPGILASVCRDQGIRLIHISTDYVFNGQSDQPYKESDPTDPQNVYGASKLLGEDRILELAAGQSIIIRTSWVFGAYGKNFVKTMMRLMKEKEQIRVVNDQQGCPTYAPDLAVAIMQMITGPTGFIPGIYHYCNDGITNWFAFAGEIRKLVQSRCIIEPIPTSAYPTPAKRPAYSVMDTSLIRNTFHMSIPNWKDSLASCMKRLS